MYHSLKNVQQVGGIVLSGLARPAKAHAHARTRTPSNLFAHAHAHNLRSLRQLSTVVVAEDKCVHHNEFDGCVKVSPYEPIAAPDVSLDQHVWSNLQQWQNREAMVCIRTGRSYTYAELRDSSAKFAIFLRNKLKLKKSDVMGVCLPNIPEYMIVLLGGMEADLLVTPISPSYLTDEATHQLQISQAKFLVCTPEKYQVMNEACQRLGKEIPIACIRTRADEQLPAGTINFFELLAAKNVDYSLLKSRDIHVNAPVLLPFSSGTTGLAKGVTLSHRNMVSNCLQANSLQYFSKEDTVPAVLPFFHIYGINLCGFAILSVGARVVTLPEFRVDDLAKVLKEYEATILNLVPRAVNLIAENETFSRETAPKLRMTLSGAAPIATHDIEKYLGKFPNSQFLQGYGMTETSPVALTSPLNNTNYASVGFPLASTEAKIIPADGSSEKGLGPNQSGELCIRGPQVMLGYLNNSEASREAFLSAGQWLRTGDLAHYDEQGFFYITDRTKDLIKNRGYQVPPVELEKCIRAHPAVADVAVFGIAHSHYGETARAIVRLQPGKTATAEEIYDHVKERLAPYKRLDGGVIFVDEIPVNATGKTLRRVAKQKYSGALPGTPTGK